MQTHNIREISITGGMWVVVQLILTIACFYAPISDCVLSGVGEKGIFVFLVSIPGVLIIPIGFVLLILEKIDFLEKNIQPILVSLVFFCLIVVLLTGGLAHSPIVPLIAIVPLISGPFFDKKRRQTTLISYLIGLILIFGLSLLSFFNPPGKYPIGWEHSGSINHIIVGGITLISILIELVLINVKSNIQITISNAEEVASAH